MFYVDNKSFVENVHMSMKMKGVERVVEKN